MVGQRIEQFAFEYWNGQAGQPAAAGTTVGYKRLLRFDPVKAGRVRLRITSTRLNPTLSALGLYRMAR